MGMNKKRVLLQDIFLDEEFFSDDMKNMLVRGNINGIKKEKDFFVFEPGEYDFSTYFNSLSIKKWDKYTYADGFQLELDIKGEFCIDICGYSPVKKKTVQVKKIETKEFECSGRKHISVEINEKDFELVSFILTVRKKTELYKGYYSALVENENIKDIHITLLTTTYKKEEYVKRNKEILEKTIFKDGNVSDNFNWVIVDNGKSEELSGFNSSKIRVFPNKNSGGAGGAARGMIEIDAMDTPTTHVLIMDDDVKFISYSLYKLLYFLRILKERYDNSFISGAMLEMERPYYQHEDVGTIKEYAIVGSAKRPGNMNRLSSIVLNERFLPEDKHQYSAWWFCCVPKSVARSDNLPMPLFVRDDDIEYSIRNKAEIISMNGICIWHNAFGGRFNYATDIYQSFRNELIVSSIHKNLYDAGIFQKVYDFFWKEIYKFNYNGASLVADALEDYLKGPGFLAKTDGGEVLKKKKLKEDERYAIPAEIKNRIDKKTLYRYEPLDGLRKHIYDYTYNGQKRMTFSIKGKKGIIPFGWPYHQKKMFLCEEIYGIDIINDNCVHYKKDIRKFRELEHRFNKIMDKYNQDGKKVKKDYIKALDYFRTAKFWRDYLDIE